MKPIIQNTKTGCYFRGKGDWTGKSEEAFVFNDATTALLFSDLNGFSDVQIVLKFENDSYHLPLRLPTKTRRSAPLNLPESSWGVSNRP